MGFISVNVVRKLEMIPIAPDGTVQMGAPILTSEDAGVVGMFFENLLWCILLPDEGFSVWSGVYIRCDVCTMVFIQCRQPFGVLYCWACP